MFDNDLDNLTWQFFRRPIMSQMRVWADSARTIPVPYAKTLITPQGGVSPLASRLTDANGATAWDELCPQPHARYGVTVEASGFALFEQSYPNIFTDIDIVLTPAVVTLSRLTTISGHRMVNDRGERVYGRGADAFLLYKKYLDGQDVEPFLSQHQALGFNLLRVFGMFESLGGFDPRQYANYYTSIESFCSLCEMHGLYVYWVCCAATQGIFNTDSAVIAHIQKTVEQLKTTSNALASPVNEQGQHNNSINLTRVKAEVDFGWLLHDMGSYGMDIPCSAPFGTHACLHVNRRYSNSVRDCCILDNPNYVTDHLEVALDEPDRYGDEGNMIVQQAADAAGTAYTALLFVFHSMQGERAEVLRGNTLECASAAVNAMKGHG